MDLQVLEVSAYNTKLVVNGELRTDGSPGYSSRRVFIFDDFVIKFESGFGIQNRDELSFYNEVLEEKDAKYFPKILGFGQFEKWSFIVQEKVHNAKEADEYHIDTLRYLINKYELYDLIVSMNCAGNHHNVAITEDDKLFIYDIGMRNQEGDYFQGGDDSEFVYEFMDENEDCEHWSECTCEDCKGYTAIALYEITTGINLQLDEENLLELD